MQKDGGLSTGLSTGHGDLDDGGGDVVTSVLCFSKSSNCRDLSGVEADPLCPGREVPLLGRKLEF